MNDGTLSSGQGHATSFAQLISEWLGIAASKVSIVTSDSDRVSVWGDWTKRYGGREESIGIRSALVSPATAMSLLVALQTTANPRDYAIPAAGSRGR